jgi:hypothetical protein
MRCGSNGGRDAQGSITLLLSALVGLGAVTLVAFPAQAQDLQLQLGKHGLLLKLMEDCDPAYDGCEGLATTGATAVNREAARKTGLSTRRIGWASAGQG